MLLKCVTSYTRQLASMKDRNNIITIDQYWRLDTLLTRRSCISLKLSALIRNLIKIHEFSTEFIKTIFT